MNQERSETLVIVERDFGIGIEIRELIREGDTAFLIFARSDGTECRIKVDPSKIQAFRGNIDFPIDFLYRGGVIKAPQRDVVP